MRKPWNTERRRVYRSGCTTYEFCGERPGRPFLQMDSFLCSAEARRALSCKKPPPGPLARPRQFVQPCGGVTEGQPSRQYSGVFGEGSGEGVFATPQNAGRRPRQLFKGFRGFATACRNGYSRQGQRWLYQTFTQYIDSNHGKFGPARTITRG